jgi:hypothetical protein
MSAGSEVIVRVAEPAGHHADKDLVRTRWVQLDVVDLPLARNLRKYGRSCLHGVLSLVLSFCHDLSIGFDRAAGGSRLWSAVDNSCSFLTATP